MQLENLRIRSATTQQLTDRKPGAAILAKGGGAVGLGLELFIMILSVSDDETLRISRS